MMRTQIQLTEAQAGRLRALAAHEGVSMAEVIRRLLDEAPQLVVGASEEERRARAIAVVGRFASGESKISAQHDRYLGEAYAS